MTSILYANSKIALAGGNKFLLNSGDPVPPSGGGDPGPGPGGPGPGPGGPGPTTMTFIDYQSAHTYGRPMAQRKAGTYDDTRAGTADIPVSFSYTGTDPSSVHAQVYNTLTSQTIVSWKALENVVLNTTTKTGVGVLKDVPAGCDYVTQLRDGANWGTLSNIGTRTWGIGMTLLAFGQSNMVFGVIGAGSYLDVPPGSGQPHEVAYFTSALSGGSFFGTDGWISTGATDGTGSTNSGSQAGPSNGGSLSIVRILSAALTRKYGRKIPVTLIPWATSSLSITEFLPGGSMYKIFSNAGTTSSNIGFLSPHEKLLFGDLEGGIWLQGEANSGTTRAWYEGKLEELYRQLLGIVAPYGRTAADLFFLPAMLGSYTNVNPEPRRGAAIDLENKAKDTSANGLNWPRVRIGLNGIDLDPEDGNDGLHFLDSTDTGTQGTHPKYDYKRWAKSRFVQSVLQQIKCSNYSGVGPRIVSWARSGFDVTFTVQHEGGTSLAARNGGLPPSGFYANTAPLFTGTDIAPTAVTITGLNTIKVTLPGSTVFPCYMKYMGGNMETTTNSRSSQHPDLTNPVYDDAQYPQGCTGIDSFVGLPLVPTPDSMTVT